MKVETGYTETGAPAIIHMNEYIDLIHSDTMSKYYDRDLYRIKSIKNMQIPIMCDGRMVNYKTILAGSIGGLVSGPHNFDFSDGVVWINKDSVVTDQAIVKEGEICNSFISGNAKVNINYLKFNNITIRGKFIIDLKGSIDYNKLNITPYESQENDEIVLTGHGDIMQVTNPFNLDYGASITIYDPGDLPNKRDIIYHYVYDHIIDAKPDYIGDSAIYNIVSKITDLAISYFSLDREDKYNEFK